MLNSDDADIYQFRGIAYMKFKQYDQARNDIEKAISLNLDESLCDNAKEWLSQIALEEFGAYVDETSVLINDNEKLKEEIEKCDEALKINPNDIKSYERKGFCLCFLHQYSESIKIYDKILELDPNNKSAYNSKGISLHSLEKFKEAITCFEKVIEFDPQDYDTYTWIGMCFEKLEKYKEAISFYDKALVIKPDWNIAQTYKESCLSMLGENTN